MKHPLKAQLKRIGGLKLNEEIIEVERIHDMESQIFDVKPCNPDVHRFIGKVIGKAFYQ